MESKIESSAAAQLRELVEGFMGQLQIPESTPAGEAPVRRGDGVLEFYKNWRVRGQGKVDGLYASYSNNDDVIEFGLTERVGHDTVNVMQASLVLDDERGELNVSSETESELNFDAVVLPQAAEPLRLALLQFEAKLRGE